MTEYLVTIEGNGKGEQTIWNNISHAKRYIKEALVRDFGYTKNQANEKLRYYDAARIKRNGGLKMSTSNYYISIDIGV